MVNTRVGSISTKGLLLSRLRELGGERISGETLAGELGVSRVAVWKAASSLRDAGYALDADDGGYRLDPSAQEDFLYPWEFGDREPLFRHYLDTTSTMDRARELASRGGEAGSVVVAERQSAGRGRAGRDWESGEGGLFFTVLLRPGTPALRYARTALAAQLAIAEAIEKTTGAAARPRWPNDVFVGGKKIAGTLVEFEAEGDLTRRMTVGIGVNVNNRLANENAVSCSGLALRKVSRREILLAFLESFDIDAADERGHDLIDRWNASAEGVGSRAALVDARHGSAVSRDTVRGGGRFRGVDEFGRVCVETDSGIRYYDAGTCSLRFDVSN